MKKILDELDGMENYRAFDTIDRSRFSINGEEMYLIAVYPLLSIFFDVSDLPVEAAETVEIYFEVGTESINSLSTIHLFNI